MSSREELIAEEREAEKIKGLAAKEKIAGLTELMHAVKMDAKLEDAEKWCEEMGAESVGEIGEADMIGEFIEALGLKPIKAKLLRQKLEEAAAAGA